MRCNKCGKPDANVLTTFGILRVELCSACDLECVEACIENGLYAAYAAVCVDKYHLQVQVDCATVAGNLIALPSKSALLTVEAARIDVQSRAIAFLKDFLSPSKGAFDNA